MNRNDLVSKKLSNILYVVCAIGISQTALIPAHFRLQWLRSAVSRPPSPSGHPNLPVFTPTHSRSNSPTPGELAKLTRKDTIEVPRMEPLGSRLSRTETVTRHAPILEHRETMEALGMNQDPVPYEGNGEKSNGN